MDEKRCFEVDASLASIRSWQVKGIQIARKGHIIPFLIFCAAIGGVLGVTVTVVEYKFGLGADEWLPIFFIYIAFVGLFYLLFCKYYYSRLPLLKARGEGYSCEICFSDEGVDFRDQASVTHIYWPAFDAIVVDKSGVSFMYKAYVFVIAAKYFEGAEDMRKFAEACRDCAENLTVYRDDLRR